MSSVTFVFFPPTTVNSPRALQRTPTVVKAEVPGMSVSSKSTPFRKHVQVGQSRYESGAQCAIIRRSFICTGTGYCRDQINARELSVKLLTSVLWLEKTRGRYKTKYLGLNNKSLLSYPLLYYTGTPSACFEYDCNTKS